MAFATLFAASAVFVQAQLKYGAERDDFIHRWYERPLHQDSSFQDASDGSFLNMPAWRKTVESIQVGKIDGISFFASRKDRRWDVFGKSLLPGSETGLLPILSPAKGMDGYIDVAARAVEAPNSYRVGGKVVLPLREGAVDCGTEFLTKMKRVLTERFGDRFLLLPQGCVFSRADYNNGNPSAESFARAKENLRAMLRAGDGFMYHWFLEGLVERRYSREVFESTAGKVIKEIFAEDEFRGKKILGLHFNGGHLNSYRWQFNCDANATATLCDRFETALTLSPGLVVLGEWDEENENTHFRPIVSRGNSYLRIVRHFADRLNRRAPSPIPGDDTAVPNLILSYRKAVVVGETVDAEVRNIPDGTFGGKSISVTFSWLDAEGRTVKKFVSRSLDASKQGAVRFSVPSTDLSDHRVLRAHLRVEWNGGFREYSDGLYRLGIRAVRNLDHMWVLHPLRDVPCGVEGELEIGERDSFGVYTVRGKVSSPVELRSVEVLDDMDSAYVHSLEPEIPAGHEQIRVSINGLFGNRDNRLAVNGTICFRNAPGARLRPLKDGRRVAEVDGCVWRLSDVLCDNFGSFLTAAIPESEMANGLVEIDLPPHFRGFVKLSDLLDREVVGFNSTSSCGLSVMRCLPTQRLPRPLNRKSVEFSFKWRPLEKASVLRLQAIDCNYRVWRGASRTVYRQSGRIVPVDVYDMSSRKTVKVGFDANRFDNLHCDIAGRTDSVLHMSQGRMFAGMVGASAAIAQGFGRGESHYGNPLAEAKRHYLSMKGNMMPKEGWGCLPLQVVPGFAGFELTMKIKPAGFGERQGLFGSGNCGLDVTLEKDGSVRALFAGGDAFTRKFSWLSIPVTGPVVKDGEWNTVKVATDRRTAWIEVNGVRGDSVAYSDYFFNQRYALFGVTLGKPNFFKGEIASLSVEIK